MSDRLRLNRLTVAPSKTISGKQRSGRIVFENPRASALRFKKRFIRIGTTGYRAIAADVFLDNWFA
jgi:hypothetical protein